MRFSFFLAVAVLGSTVAVPAQCPFTSVATESIGPGCNFGSTGSCEIVSTPTRLTVSFDPGSCRLTLQVIIFEGCGATVPLRAIAFGVQRAFLPLPHFGLGCALHEVPIFVVPTTGSLNLPLPPGLPPFSFLAQALALSSFPLGGPDVLTFSDALAIALQ